ncbi:caspase family protein, partial [Acinetobacter baumannii]
MKTLFFAALAILALTLPAGAAERRIALIVGNANYQTGSLPTPANDAGLVAQTLQAAGFDVSGARDLDQESLR